MSEYLCISGPVTVPWRAGHRGHGEATMLPGDTLESVLSWRMRWRLRRQVVPCRSRRARRWRHQEWYLRLRAALRDYKQLEREAQEANRAAVEAASSAAAAWTRYREVAEHPPT